MMHDLSEKSVFLTGAGGVLGTSHIANLLARSATVVASELPGARYDALQDKFGDEKGFHLYPLNVTDEAQVARCFSDIANDGLAPNVFINNAAVTGELLMRDGKDFPDLSQTPLDAWQAALDVNLTGAFLIAREIDRQVVSKRPFQLINVASMYALNAPHHNIYEGMPFKNFSAYSATKAGIHGLTLWLASYWADENATVNTLAPGAVFNGHSQTFQDRVSNLIMMGRMAQPEEISDALAFLCSDNARYMTGQVLNIDGGFSSW